MPKQRVTELDFMRSVAIFMVVVLHATARFMVYGLPKSRTFMLSLALNQWSRVSLPLFVFLSGFGLFYNNKEFELKTYAKKRLARVFLPYCTWTLLYMVRRDLTDPAFCFLKLPAFAAFLKYIQWLFWKNIDTPLWFILMIMQMYILFPLILDNIGGKIRHNESFSKITGKHITIHTKTRDVYTFFGNLKEVENRLKGKNFVR